MFVKRLTRFISNCAETFYWKSVAIFNDLLFPHKVENAVFTISLAKGCKQFDFEISHGRKSNACKTFHYLFMTL